MKQCAVCENEYPDDITVCPLDGTAVRQPGSHHDPFVGRVIRGRYRVERQLGEGGMGTVYLAEQLSVGGRKVALKVLRADFARSPEFVARFRQEAKLVAALNEKHNPRVTVVHDFDQADDGSLFIVMEWLEGQLLNEVIQRQGALGLQRAVRVAMQIAEGLEAAHRAGVIHRDVKPHNIMVLAATDDIKLMDFGIARLRDASTVTRLTRTGDVIGTPAYMAPEQIEGGEITTRVDIYAFGLVFYEMLTGVRPFRADTAGALLAKQLREAPVPPSRLRPEIPLEIDEIVLTALSKDPMHRQSSLGEIVRRLGEGTETRLSGRAARDAPGGEPGPIEQDRATARRGWVARATRYVAAIAGCGAAIAILAISGAHFFAAPPRPQATSASPDRLPEPSVPPASSPQLSGPKEAGSGPSHPLSLGAFHALVVGNSDYTSYRRLRTAVSDAEAVAALLRERYGFKVKLLRNVTRAQMLSELYELRDRLTETDNVLIYYAGHGELDQVSQRGYWLPVDAEAGNTASWISNSDVSDLVNLIPAKHLLVVADSCFSARSTSTSAPVARMTQEELTRALQTASATRARLVMTSGGMEPVLDSRGGQHSMFAQIFLQSLEANDGVLLGHTLFQRIQLRAQAVPQRWTAPQGPEYAPIKHAGHGGGDFLFLRTGS